MKRKVTVIAAVLLIGTMTISLGIMGGINYMNDEKRKKEEQQLVEVVKMERVATKQIKNTYADLKKIEFKNYRYNSMAGFTLVNVIASSDSIKDAWFDVILEPNGNENDSYSGAGSELQYGKTLVPVDVIFSDGSEGVI